VYITWKFYNDLVDREQRQNSITVAGQNQTTRQPTKLTAAQPPTMITTQVSASAQVFPFQN